MPAKENEEYTQMSLFDYAVDKDQEIIEELRGLKLEEMTPLEALNILSDIKKRLL